MVFFSCGSCGESIKKNQVEKHYQFKCRNCSVLSCIDCGKDFWGDEYKEHTKCISEEEKYSGKDYKPKPGANKGEVKQELWTNQVQQAIAKAANNAKLKNILGRLVDYPNIPRKKAKFENFVGNSMGVRNKQLTSQVWDLISAEMQLQKQDGKGLKQESEPQHSISNGEAAIENEAASLSKREKKEMRSKEQTRVDKKRKKLQDNIEIEENSKQHNKKKRKHKDEDEEADIPHENKKRKKIHDVSREESHSDEAVKENVQETKKNKKKKKDKHKSHEEEESNENVHDETMEEECIEEETSEKPKGKFKWEAAIIGILKRSDDNELSIKRLRKKVMAEYAARNNDESISEKQLAKFNKKINKNARLKVHKDRVKLLS